MKISSELVSGIIFIVMGVSICLYSYSNYHLGSIQMMGPGYMPVILSSILALLGVANVLVSCFSNKTHDLSERKISIRKSALIVLSVISFALTITSLGLIVATVLLVFISSFADKRFNIKLTICLAVSLCTLSLIVFSYFLKMTMPILW